MQIGAQLFSVRDYTTNIEDFANTLEKVADIGYKVVQVSGTCAFEPEWLKNQLQRVGLTCAVTHTNAARLETETEKVAVEHSVFGCTNIGIGSMPNLHDDIQKNYNAFRDTFLPVAKALKEQGSKFMYHNHNFEFARIANTKENYLERMAKDFSKEELSFILDTYWIQAAGGDPVQWIKKLAGRLECVHLKDMIYHEEGTRFAPVYEGNMNFDAIIEACHEAGTEYLLVEQDNCFGQDPFECLSLSYQNLKAKGLQ